MEKNRITPPLDEETARSLKAGDQVLISGSIYAARDAAHKLMVEALKKGESLPFNPKNQIIYYVGPCPARPGEPIGAAGPTTSGRMDAYAPLLIAKGLRGMIGKGLRSEAVIEAMKEHSGVYFAATGGAGAMLAQRIKRAEVIAYPELGPEALHRFEVEDFPVIVVIDSAGNNLYKTGQDQYRRKLAE